MKKESNIIKHTIIMTVINLLIRSVGVGFNLYLTNIAGSAGLGLFQLIMSVYSLAVTFSSAGIRLATTRITVEINAKGKYDKNKSLGLCITYSGFCGALTGLILLVFSDFISKIFIENSVTSLPLKILSLSLPFVSMSSALSGYFTAEEKIPQFSVIQFFEQIFKVFFTVLIINKSKNHNIEFIVCALVTGMTAAEIFSFFLSMVLKTINSRLKSSKEPILLSRFLRIALPDSVGTCTRNILLTIEHILIPKGLRKSGINSSSALSAYAEIHSIAMPILLYPSAIVSSFSTLIIPEIAKRNEIGDKDGINISASRTLKRTLLYSLFCSMLCFVFAPFISDLIYKSNEAAKYIRILSPLVPVMFLDIVTDGLLKGLDQQIYSMSYNIIDSFLCVIMVYVILPKYSVIGYIFILYASEIINFFLSFSRLISICDIRFFEVHAIDNSIFSRSKKYSVFHKEYEYQKYQVQRKRNQAL